MGPARAARTTTDERARRSFFTLPKGMTPPVSTPKREATRDTPRDTEKPAGDEVMAGTDEASKELAAGRCTFELGWTGG